ncbi:DNA polymerase III subunit epsilon [Corynebacterium cystitidis]|uniref:DNA polymerase III subunit epsilon n=1 Tax=Corynebacterium cystitidis TaxID=35757 RepID=UPI00211F42FB|nr:DNA polymerase III subunit epsilon [Corynebacterium cystitidis]
MTTEQELSHPFVAVHVQSTGIHPSTGRLLTLDAVTFDNAGSSGEDFHTIFNTGGDPGPVHRHGVPYDEFGQAQRFSRHLKTLDRLIDGRTLIVHDAPQVWGFIVSEARRAMNAAARANRSRNRGRGRRRQRVGHVPQPEAIVDTLATTRRRGIALTDARLYAVAEKVQVAAPSPVASVARAQRPETETSREATLVLIELYRTLSRSGPVVSFSPKELTADRFGLQRTHARVAAEKAEPEHDNPGTYTREKGLAAGMEFVVSDDVEIAPDELITAGREAGLTYTEKLTRTASLVVTNIRSDLRGKAMHAHRKDIPLVSDKDFLAAVAQLNAGR